MAGERPYIIALLPTPPPLFGILSFSFPVLISFFLYSPLASFSSFHFLFFFSPHFLFFLSPLKKEGSFATLSFYQHGIAVKPAAWPPQPGRFQTILIHQHICFPSVLISLNYTEMHSKLGACMSESVLQLASVLQV